MTITATASIRRGVSQCREPEQAVADLHEQIAQDDAALVFVFCSSIYDRSLLAAAIQREFQGVPVVGCTTSGELSQLGYTSGSLTGISLGAADFEAEVQLLTGLHSFRLEDGRKAALTMRRRLDECGETCASSNTFGLLLVDGLSAREELVASALFEGLQDISLCGGSAGDDTQFERTWIYHDGQFLQDAAVFTLVRTSRPFTVFKTEHFVGSGERMVITGADAGHRVVTEINGEPAAEEYARLTGLEGCALTPQVFATHPVLIRVNGLNFVRSIQKVNPDGSLTFYCSIDEGLVLTVANGIDLEDSLNRTLQEVRDRIGPPEVIIGFDCVLRRLEVDQAGIQDRVGTLLSAHQVTGFQTYGEQYNGMHVNQTLTGVAIGTGST